MLSEAFDDYKKVSEINPRYGGAYMGMANIYAVNGQNEEAVANYQLAKKYDIKYGKPADIEIKKLTGK